jgi:hypothetical protein
VATKRRHPRGREWRRAALANRRRFGAPPEPFINILQYQHKSARLRNLLKDTASGEKVVMTAA